MAIFITQDSRKNFTQLLKISHDLRFIVNSDCPTIGSTDAHKARIDRVLDGFNPDTDYLVLVGDPINIGLCIHAVMRKGEDVTVLKWDRQNEVYARVILKNKQ